MKESSCGRIVSQRKLENSLLRQYNTNTSINFTRINDLKRKYTKPTPIPQPLSRSPLLNLTNIQQTQPTLLSEFTLQIRQKLLTTLDQSHRQRGEQMRKLRDDGIEEYRRKAELTNNLISQRLDTIQYEITRLRNRRELDLLRDGEVERDGRDREISGERMQRKVEKERQIESVVRLPESIKVSKIEQYQESSMVEQIIDQKLNGKLFHKAHKIQQSTIKLLGEFKKERIFTDEFTIFINRLKDQISLDIDFTQILLSLPLKDRDAIRDYIRRYHSSADLQFFMISPIEHDPLQTQAKVSYSGSIQSIGRKLYEFYVKIQDHYRLKLFQNFQMDTIETLFWEIGEKEITLGHLISYINMRTGKEFRNRALVKLLRRLGIANHIIDMKAFVKGFVRPF